MQALDITVVMPALNEESAIKDAVESTFQSFKKLSLKGEIIVVNDGSRDRTKETVASLIDRHGQYLRILNHDMPQGMGRSFWDGARLARGESVTLLPGDNENNPDEILRYAGLTKNVDMVVPFVVNKNVRPFSRRILSMLFTKIINFSFRTSFKYTNGTVIYRTSVIKDIVCRSNGFFFQAETLIRLAKKGALAAEVPYFLSERKGGESKAVKFSSFIKVCGDYIRLLRDIYLPGGKR